MAILEIALFSWLLLSSFYFRRRFKQTGKPLSATASFLTGWLPYLCFLTLIVVSWLPEDVRGTRALLKIATCLLFSLGALFVVMPALTADMRIRRGEDPESLSGRHLYLIGFALTAVAGILLVFLAATRGFLTYA